MKTLKTILLVFASILMVCSITACSKQSDSTDSKGRPINLSDYKGKWVVINYWATWCKPCMKEMPALNKLYQTNRDKLVVLGVSYDRLPTKKIDEIATKMSIQYPMLSTFPLKKIGINHLDVLPITFVINPDGQLVKTLKGPQTQKQFQQAVQIKKQRT